MDIKLYPVFVEACVEQPNPDNEIMTRMFAHAKEPVNDLDANTCYKIDGQLYGYTGTVRPVAPDVGLAYFAPLKVPVDLSDGICRCVGAVYGDEKFDFTEMLKGQH